MSDPASSTTTAASGGPGNIVAQARALWTKLPPRARLGAIASTVAIVGLVAYLVLSGGGPGWKPVTEGLTQSDVLLLIRQLDTQGIEHRVRKTTILEVPANRLAEAKVAASVAGVPRAHRGYEMLNKSTMGMTKSREDAMLANAQEDALARTIEQLGPIESAEVHIAAATTSVFVHDKENAKASVQVHLRPGAMLTPSQVRGIKSLVAYGVKELSIDQVEVIDQDANPLSSEDDKSGDEQAVIEDNVATNVRQMLGTLVGLDKVKVVAQVEIDRRAISKTEEHFDDPKVLSRQESSSGAPPPTATASGIAGTQGNLPGSPAASIGTSATGGGTTTTLTNNSLGKTIISTQEPATRIAKIHVAVLIDDGVDDDGEPVARTEAELAQYKEIARTAAGLDEARGDQLTLTAMSFAPIEAPAVVVAAPKAKLPAPLPVLVGGGALIIAALAFFLIRGRRKPAEDSILRIALPAPVAELERAFAAPTLGSGEPALAPALASGRSLEERVVGAVKADVQRASRVLASWLAEPDPVPTTPHAKARA